jgi:hypothetical protein
MSRLFRKTDDDMAQATSEHGHLPSLYELGPQLDEVVKQAAALPLEQLAEQLMTQFFTTEYMVASEIKCLSSVAGICWDLLPDNSGEKARDPIPDAFT